MSLTARISLGKKVEFVGTDGGRESWLTFLPADHDPASTDPVAMSLTMFVSGQTADHLIEGKTYTLRLEQDETA